MYGAFHTSHYWMLQKADEVDYDAIKEHSDYMREYMPKAYHHYHDMSTDIFTDVAECDYDYDIVVQENALEEIATDEYTLSDLSYFFEYKPDFASYWGDYVSEIELYYSEGYGGLISQ